MRKALIAVRSGSERVKNKNSRSFCDSNLLEIKIKQLQRVMENGFIDGIVVNSNDPDLLEIAEKYDCELVLRDEYFAEATTSMSEVYKNMAINFNGDTIVYTNVTNPLLEDSTIEDAIKLFQESNNDSVNTAHLIKEFLFNEDSNPVNYNLRRQPRSQDLPNIYALNFAVNVISKHDMIDLMNVVGLNPYIMEIDEREGIDIDNIIDFEIAEYLYAKEHNFLKISPIQHG